MGKIKITTKIITIVLHLFLVFYTNAKIENNLYYTEQKIKEEVKIVTLNDIPNAEKLDELYNHFLKDNRKVIYNNSDSDLSIIIDQYLLKDAKILLKQHQLLLTKGLSVSQIWIYQDQKYKTEYFNFDLCYYNSFCIKNISITNEDMEKLKKQCVDNNLIILYEQPNFFIYKEEDIIFNDKLFKKPFKIIKEFKGFL